MDSQLSEEDKEAEEYRQYMARKIVKRTIKGGVGLGGAMNFGGFPMSNA